MKRIIGHTLGIILVMLSLLISAGMGLLALGYMVSNPSDPIGLPLVALAIFVFFAGLYALAAWVDRAQTEGQW